MERRIVPFYMAYPLPVNYQDEQEMVRDMEYLQSQHSMEIRQLRKHIADTINIMDYEGSMIYDEYPDRYMLYHLVRKIMDEMKAETDIEIMSDGILEDLVEVLLFHEISRRRCRRKRCRRAFYK